MAKIGTSGVLNEETIERAESLAMFDLEDDEPGTDDLRDPGLHPGFSLYIANMLYGYLRFAPGRINQLASSWQLTYHHGLTDQRRYVRYARAFFLDSGAVGALIGVNNKRVDVDVALNWLNRTDEVVIHAWMMHDEGSPPGVVAAMDLPMYSDLLAVVGMSVDQAHQVNVRNAQTMLDADIPPGWKRVFTSQGISVDDHRRCLEEYERLGIVDQVRQGHAWLAVGGMAFEKSAPRVHQVHRMARQLVGETGHIHALGVSRIPALIPMIKQGLVDSADSSSPCLKVRFNSHPLYTVKGPRPTFLVESLHAASSLHAEAKLALDLKRDDGYQYEQSSMFDEGSEPL